MTIANENTTGNISRTPSCRSPLHATHQTLQAQFEEYAGWQLPGVYKSVAEEVATVQQYVGVCDISAGGVLRIRGTQAHKVLAAMFDTAPASVGDVIVVRLEHGQSKIASLTRDEFLILTGPSTYSKRQAIEQMLMRQVESEQFVSVVDQTSGMAGLLIAGPASRSLMSKLCALSFHSDAFPNLHVAQSSFAKVHATLLRNDFGEVPVFELYVDRSYAVYVWETLMDAGQEFDIVPVGWTAIESLVGERTHSTERV